MKLVPCLTMVLALLVDNTQAENRIFNSNFKLGLSGYSVCRYQRSETNPSFEYEPLKIDKTTSSVSGGQSLYIPNSFSEQVLLNTREFKLEPGVEYQVSVYMKSAAEGYPVMLRLLSFSTTKGAWGSDTKHTFNVSKEWNCYSFTFATAPADKECEFYTLFIESCRDPEIVGSGLWIDRLEVAPASEAPALPCPPEVEVAVSLAKNLYALPQSEAKKIPAKILAANNSDQKLSAKVILYLTDKYTKERKEIQKSKLTLKPSEVKTTPISVNVGKFGAYQLEAELQPADKISWQTLPSSFALVGKYKREPIDLSTTYCVGVNGGTAEIHPPYFNQIKKTGFPARGTSQSGYFDLLAEMGCRIIRDWDGDAGNSFLWYNMEPEEGKFDFSLADRTVPLAAEHGITLLPVVGGRIGVRDDCGIPAWLRPRCVKRTETPYHNRPATTPLIPPEESWRKYVRAIGDHFKGQLAYYEILNEPNADYFPKEYLMLLKAASEELKAADPKCKIVAFCSSGDYGLPPADFLVSGAKEGGLDYSDVVSYHPYETPNLAKGADRMNRVCLFIIHKHAPKRTIPLWNTELYYLTGWGKNPYEKGLYEPQDAAQRFLTDLGDGLGQSICVPASSLWDNDLTPHLSGGFGNQWIPSSRFVVYNALARHFEGAKPAGKLNWGTTSVCYLFQRGDSILAAFWDYGKTSGLKVKFTDALKGAKLYDLFGNELATDKDEFPINAAPHYVEWEKGSLDSIQANLAKTVVTTLTAAAEEGKKP